MVRQHRFYISPRSQLLDEDEKSAKVAKMDEIYGKAVLTSSSLAFERMGKTANSCEKSFAKTSNAWNGAIQLSSLYKDRPQDHSQCPHLGAPTTTTDGLEEAEQIDFESKMQIAWRLFQMIILQPGPDLLRTDCYWATLELDPAYLLK